MSFLGSCERQGPCHAWAARWTPTWHGCWTVAGYKAEGVVQETLLRLADTGSDR